MNQRTGLHCLSAGLLHGFDSWAKMREWFRKQHGSQRKRILYDYPKGGDPREWPENLRVREWPK